MNMFEKSLLMFLLAILGIGTAVVYSQESKSPGASPTQYISLGSTGVQTWFIEANSSRLYHCIATPSRTFECDATTIK